ncbi:MFS transporter [Streptomyces sp. NBC_01239]|uniref:MFS transporter n=1 Tax=Streptomyces sp. NBC_01239 TaxID=2903792 RepID=UPI0022561E78|nr:MFS transporter [Streptomyces sp. NBC_01239]MCX4811217.1 MFS transporter [Streptomyces sp. NBC_01239]
MPPTPPAPSPPAPKTRLTDRMRGVALDTRPLQHPIFRRLLIGQSAAYVGTMVTDVTIPVQVYGLSRSSLFVGLTGVAGLVPLVVFGLYGGAVADRFDRRTLYLASASLTWVVTLALLFQAVADVRSVPLILGLVAVQAGAFAVASAARGAIIPRIVPTPLVPAANTLYFTAGNVGQVAGPLIAGVLISLPNGYSWAYGADALLFSLLLYSALRLPSVKPIGEGAATTGGLRSVLDGLRFITAAPVLWMSFAVDIAAMTLAMPTALFPQAAQTRFGGGVGLLYSAIAIGSVAAGLFSGWIGRVRRQGRALAIAVVAWATAVALAGTVHQLLAAAALLAAAGAADLVSAVYRQTILQTYAPDALRGRLQGVFTVVVAGGPRLGDLRAGAMASTTGLGLAWTGSSLLCVVVVIAGALLVRPFWHYDVPAALPASSQP